MPASTQTVLERFSMTADDQLHEVSWVRDSRGRPTYRLLCSHCDQYPQIFCPAQKAFRNYRRDQVRIAQKAIQSTWTDNKLIHALQYCFARMDQGEYIGEAKHGDEWLTADLLTYVTGGNPAEVMQQLMGWALEGILIYHPCTEAKFKPGPKFWY